VHHQYQIHWRQIFAGVVDTGGNDTGGQFDTDINDAGGKLPPVSMTPAANCTGGKQWEQYQAADNLK
jgi:hypothetical protein